MAMNTDKAQRSVFVGNIPYDVSEAKLREIFSKVGPIASFRLVYDKETGKPKGYGFCEYADVETAQSALRNLANCDVNGRPLRVGPAAGEQHFDNQATANYAQVVNVVSQQVGQNTTPAPCVPDITDPSKVTQCIVETVQSMSPENLSEVLRNLKYFAVSNPSEARMMLCQNSALAYAILQSMVVLGAVDTKSLHSFFHKPGCKDSVSAHVSNNPQSYEPIYVDTPPQNMSEYASNSREYYNPVPYRSDSSAQLEYYSQESPYRCTVNEGYRPSKKRKARTNFDPRNFPRFSTSFLKSILAGKPVDENEKSEVISILIDLSDEQIERYLPREQVSLAFSIRRRFS